MTAYVPLNAFLPYLAAGWTFATRGGLPVADAMVGHHGRYCCLMVRGAAATPEPFRDLLLSIARSAATRAAA